MSEFQVDTGLVQGVYFINKKVGDMSCNVARVDFRQDGDLYESRCHIDGEGWTEWTEDGAPSKEQALQTYMEAIK